MKTKYFIEYQFRGQWVRCTMEYDDVEKASITAIRLSGTDFRWRIIKVETKETICVA